MKCRKVEALLSLYIDRQLGAGTHRGVKEHLLRCAGCSQRLKELQEIIKAASAAPTLEPPDGYYGRIQRRLQEPIKEPTFERSYLRLSLKGLATAATVVLVFLVIRQIYPLQRVVPSMPEETFVADEGAKLRKTEEEMVSAAEISRAVQELESAIVLPVYRGEDRLLSRGALPVQVSLGEGEGIIKEWKGYYSGYKGQANLVVQDQREWEDLWKVHTSNVISSPPTPAINFEEQMAVGVFMGERSTGGYKIEMKGLEKREEGIVVKYSETSPPKDAFVTQVLTQPYHICITERTSLPIEFQKLQ